MPDEIYDHYHQWLSETADALKKAGKISDHDHTE